MKIVDFNNWDAEVEVLESCKNRRIICIVLRCMIYAIWGVCLALFIPTFYDIQHNDKLYWICAITFLIERYLKQVQNRCKDYEIKNLVFCIIDEDSLIDANYIKERSEVAITFQDIRNGNIEEIFVECETKIDAGIEEDTLTIYPNSAQLVLRAN